MKLLIVTQTINEKDPTLGFFTRWVEEFSKQVELVQVIALGVGEYSLPQNVAVHTLGKEKGRQNPFFYSIRFLQLVWKLRGTYDTVFVHQNQEYILLAGLFWKLFGKKIYLWRNHYAGSWKTDVAASFCTTVFCTSAHSYTAKYKKTVFMPVGVDTKEFYPNPEVLRVPNSILFLARMAPSKHPEVLLEALFQLQKEPMQFTATFVGSPLPEDEHFYEELKKRALPLGEQVTFLPAVPKSEAVHLFQTHEIFVNCSRSGMFDKTMFEALACGAITLSSSDDFTQLVGKEYGFPQGEALALAELLRTHLSTTSKEREKTKGALLQVAKNNALGALLEKVSKYMHTIS